MWLYVFFEVLLAVLIIVLALALLDALLMWNNADYAAERKFTLIQLAKIINLEKILITICFVAEIALQYLHHR